MAGQTLRDVPRCNPENAALYSVGSNGHRPVSRSSLTSLTQHLPFQQAPSLATPSTRLLHLVYPTSRRHSCIHPVIVYLRVPPLSSTRYGTASKFCFHQEAATHNRSSAREAHREVQTDRSPERAIASKRFQQVARTSTIHLSVGPHQTEALTRRLRS